MRSVAVPLSQLRVRLRHTATTATTPGPAAIAFHLKQVNSRNGFENVSRRLVNTAASPEMTGIVIDNFFVYALGKFQSSRMNQTGDVFDAVQRSETASGIFGIFVPDPLAAAASDDDCFYPGAFNRR